MSGAGLLLDRDGVVNVDHGYVHRIEQVTFLPGLFDLAREAARRGMPIAIVTNQSGIGRGFYTEADFAQVMGWMAARFAAEGAPLAAVYHAADVPGVASTRRKPAPGMLLEAAAALGLEVATSVMLGDRASDMWAAVAAGVGHRWLLPAGPGEVSQAPPGTVVVRDLGDALARLAALPG